MTKAHTPGPWSIGGPNNGGGSKFGVYCDDETGQRVADCFPQFCTLSDEQARANARLIAAAPELLEALEHAVEQLKSYGADGYASGADAAIAKAKGEA